MSHSDCGKKAMIEKWDRFLLGTFYKASLFKTENSVPSSQTASGPVTWVQSSKINYNGFHAV